MQGTEKGAQSAEWVCNLMGSLRDLKAAVFRVFDGWKEGKGQRLAHLRGLHFYVRGAEVDVSTTRLGLGGVCRRRRRYLQRIIKTDLMGYITTNTWLGYTLPNNTD